MSDNVYVPDAWVVVRIRYDDELIYKVLGGWYGGYLGQDSWRLNSGISKVETEITSAGCYWLFKGSSGSTYRCHAELERTTALTSSVLSALRASGAEIEQVPVRDIDLDEQGW